MAETFQEEVQRRLLALDDPWKSVAFASRVALLALGNLPAQRLQEWRARPWFQPWLLATQRAIFCNEALISLRDQGKTPPAAAVYAARAAAARAARAADARAAAAAARAAAAAAAAAAAPRAADARAAAAAAAAAARAADAAARADMLSMLESLEQPTITAASFLTQKLPFQLTALTAFQRSPACGEGFEFWTNWLEQRVEGVLPSSELAEQVLMLSKEVLAMEPAEINAYLLNLRGPVESLDFGATVGAVEFEETHGAVNSVRCMIVGFGYVGKTSLSRVLQGKPVESDQPRTDGFEIQPWTPDSAPELDVRLWDFAGQAMAHSCHRLFFTARCVYVIVVAAAGSKQEERLDGLLRSPTDQAEYWFEAIRPYAYEEGRKVPVLLLANKDDAGRVDLDMPHLQRRFGTDFDFDQPYYLSLQQPDQYANALQDFTSELEQRLAVVNQWQTLLPLVHHEVYRWVCDMSKEATWLKMTDFIKACDDRGISKEGNEEELSQGFLLRLLGMLGVTFDFSQKSKNNLLKDQLLLQPQWLSQAITYLIRGARSQLPTIVQKCLSLEEMESLIAAESGNSDFCTSVQCYGVIGAMVKARLAYSHGDGWVIPEALADQEPPDEAKFPADALTCHFAFPYAVPGQIFSQLMCVLHAEVEDGKVWRRGMVLAKQKYQARALVRVDYGLRRITLLVTGEGAGEYFRHLLDRIHGVFEEANITDYSELIGLPDKPNAAPRPPVRPTTAERVVDLQDLEQLRHFGEKLYHGKFGQFKLAEVFKSMDSKTDGEQHTHHHTHHHNERHTHFNGDRTAYAEGDMNNVSLGDNSPVACQIQALDAQLAEWRDQIADDVDDRDTRKAALQELKEVREALQIIQAESTVEQKQEAQSRLRCFADSVKQLAGGTIGGLKALKDGGEAIAYLTTAVPAVMTALNIIS